MKRAHSPQPLPLADANHWHDTCVPDVQEVIRRLVRADGADQASAIMLALTCRYEYAQRPIPPKYKGQGTMCPIVSHAARAGHLNLTRWLLWSCTTLKTAGYSQDDIKNRVLCPAAEGGHCHVLDHYWRKLCPPDITYGSFYALIVAAAYGGHVHMLEHLYAKNVQEASRVLNNEQQPIRTAASQGHLRAVEWLYGKSFTSQARLVLDTAIESCQLHVADWALATGHVQCTSTHWHSVALRSDDLTRTWLVAHDCPVPPTLFDAVLSRDMADWQARCEWILKHIPTAICTVKTMYVAVNRGNLAMVQWLRLRCDWGTETLNIAATLGNLIMLRHLLAAGISVLNGEILLTAAIYGGNLEMIVCLVTEYHVDAHLTVSQKSALMTTAAMSRNWDILKWLGTHDAQYKGTIGVWNRAWITRDASLLQWLLNHDCPVDWHCANPEPSDDNDSDEKEDEDEESVSSVGISISRVVD
jgi:hypothetical protein